MKKLNLLIFAILLTHFINGQNSYPGLSVIGHGYDIFGEYANNRSVKQSLIFDFSKCALKSEAGFKIPEMVYLADNSEHLINEVSASSQRDFANNLSTKVNLKCNALIFSGSVKSQFGQESSGSEERYCHSIMDANTKWKISLEYNIDNLIPYLKEQFKSDLETLDPEKLFNQYGTHFIKSAFLGGRIDYYLSTIITSDFTKQDVDIAVKARYGTMSGNGSFQNNQTNSSNLLNSEIKTSIVGGNSEFIKDVNNLEMYKTWAEGIKSNPVLCDFNEESLVPIWELTKNETRKQFLKNYFEKTIVEQHKLPSIDVNKPIVAQSTKFEIKIDGIKIDGNCENALDNTGEFVYSGSYEIDNGVENTIFNSEIKLGEEGKFYTNEKSVVINVPNKLGSSFSIKIKVTETDMYSSDALDDIVMNFNYPFDNVKFNNGEAFEERRYKKATVYESTPYCDVTVKFHIKKL